MDERSDRELLTLTHRGDKAAAGILYARFSRPLAMFARSVLHDEFLAADVVQTVFLKILALNRREIRTIIDPFAWLVRSTRNEALNLIRTDSRARARAARHASMRDAVTLPSYSTARADLLDLLNALTEDQRELIVLKHLVGLTFDQLSEALGENRSTIASRYRVAIMTLRDIASQADAPPLPSPLASPPPPSSQPHNNALPPPIPRRSPIPSHPPTPPNAPNGLTIHSKHPQPRNGKPEVNHG